MFIIVFNCVIIYDLRVNMQFTDYIPEPFNENYNSNAKSASIIAAYHCEKIGVYESENMAERALLYGAAYEFYLDKEITDEELDVAREFIK